MEFFLIRVWDYFTCTPSWRTITHRLHNCIVSAPSGLLCWVKFRFVFLIDFKELLKIGCRFRSHRCRSFTLHLVCAVRGLSIYSVSTERRGRMAGIPASYSGGPGSESLLGCWLSWLRFFMIFLITLRQIPGQYLRLGNQHFFSRPFMCIICQWAYHSALCSVRWDGAQAIHKCIAPFHSDSHTDIKICVISTLKIRFSIIY
jgi:hypothetical protein